MAQDATRPRGRPRNEATRETILDAAFAAGAGDDAQEFTIAGIASRARVSKQTVYRWWPTKGDVLLEAIARNADQTVPTGDHGSYRADLRAFFGATYDELTKPGMRAALRSLMAEAQQDAAFGERFRRGLIERRRSALAGIMDRAVDRGDYPRGWDDQLAADVAFGFLWYRLLATTRALDSADADALALLLSQPR